MSDIRTYGGLRTGGLWVAAGIAFAAVVVGSGLALFGMLEYDERCMQGMVRGPGPLLRVRYQAFPPATVCEFAHGEIASAGGRGVLAVLLWAALLVLVVSLLTALVAEWFEPRPGGSLVVPLSRTEKLRRTGVAFFATGSVFLMSYALAGWKLLAGPSSACSAGADWGNLPPRTVAYTFFPPQATCRYAAGTTERMNPDWLASLTAWLSVPALVAGVGFGLALWRWRTGRTAPRRDRGAAKTA